MGGGDGVCDRGARACVPRFIAGRRRRARVYDVSAGREGVGHAG
jgi:hypothetical protein